jgi:hypothetical protein
MALARFSPSSTCTESVKEEQVAKRKMIDTPENLCAFKERLKGE